VFQLRGKLLRASALAGLLAAGSRAEAAPDLPEIAARGSLRVLVSADEAPEWFALRPALSPGFERELLEGFGRLHHLKLEPVPVAAFDDIIPALLSGRGDVIAGINVTDQRRKVVAFTAEVMPSRHLVVTRKPRHRVRDEDALRRERVGTVAGTTWAEAARRAGVPAGRLETFESSGQALTALREDRVGAIIVSLADFILYARGDGQLEAGLLLGPPGSAAWAVRPADAALRDALSTYLGNLRRSGSWSRMVIQYFGDDALQLLGRAGQD
jgi:ABC-type amino acid transport substrate-binding protein